MRLDFRSELTTAQQRTTTLVTQALFDLLKKKNFDEISVQELCKASFIPRSTFYNHFEDKYDVFRWAIDRYVYGLFPEMELQMNQYDNVSKLADIVVDALETYRPVMQIIALRNPQNGSLHQLFRECIADVMNVIVGNCTSGKEYEYPYEVTFNLYVDGLLQIFTQAVYGKKHYSSEQLHNYMHELYHM